MKLIRILFIAHLMALAFGLGGILIALPNPELWAGSQYAGEVYNFGMEYGGALHIVLGAATMLLFGGYYIGWRRTIFFFAVTVTLSLSSELIGTGTGWPFGNYEYTDGLGYKVLGRVPFTIPLSWFYVGFASYLLAGTLAASRGLRHRALLTVLGGAYLLTVWDLVLDPAMAHESLAITFWTWSETGPYFGMPLKNFGGWALTGVLFMTISRILWRSDIGSREFPAALPFGIYLANMIFAMALSLSVGLWEPAVAAIVFGLLPAAIAWRSQPPSPEAARGRDRSPSGTSPSPAETVAWQAVRTGSGVIASRKLNLEVEGLENLPKTGPVLIASRHYHHLYDGCALISSAGRPVRILVALDWVQGRPGRTLMEWACRMVRWPVVLRGDGLANQSRSTAFERDETQRYIRRGVRESVELLRAGEALVVFPEAYPNIDPAYTPKNEETEYLPFRSGFVRLVALAQRGSEQRIPIIPCGFAYEPGPRWKVTMRLGAPVWLDGRSDRSRVAALVEDQIRSLSGQGRRGEAMVPGEAVSR